MLAVKKEPTISIDLDGGALTEPLELVCPEVCRPMSEESEMLNVVRTSSDAEESRYAIACIRDRMLEEGYDDLGALVTINYRLAYEACDERTRQNLLADRDRCSRRGTIGTLFDEGHAIAYEVRTHGWNVTVHGDPLRLSIQFWILKDGVYHEALPYLSKVLNDPETSMEVFPALRKFGRFASSMAPEVIPFFEAACTNASSAAEDALVAFGVEAVPHLTSALITGCDAIKFGCLRVLARLGSQAEAAVPVLLYELRSSERAVRLATLQTLSAIGSRSDGVVSALREMLHPHPSRVEFERIVECLGRCGAAAMPTLRYVLANHEGPGLEHIATAMAQVDSEVVPALIEDLITSDNREYQRHIIAMLPHLGAIARAAIPTLLRVEKEGSDRMSALSLSALQRLAYRDAPSLLTLVRAQNGNSATWALRRLNEGWPEFSPTDIDTLESPHAVVRIGLMTIIRKFGSSAVMWVDSIVDHLCNDDDPYVRAAAADTLGAIGVNSFAVTTALNEAYLNDPQDSVRLAAANALEDLDLAVV